MRNTDRHSRQTKSSSPQLRKTEPTCGIPNSSRSFLSLSCRLPKKSCWNSSENLALGLLQHGQVHLHARKIHVLLLPNGNVIHDLFGWRQMLFFWLHYVALISCGLKMGIVLNKWVSGHLFLSLLILMHMKIFLYIFRNCIPKMSKVTSVTTWSLPTLLTFKDSEPSAARMMLPQGRNAIFSQDGSTKIKILSKTKTSEC